jgi:transcriptional regulator with XRE-family HTH domain
MTINLESKDDVFGENYRNPDYWAEIRRTKPQTDLIAQVINRRSELDLTQEELAEKARTYQSRISKIESGEHDFRLSTIVEIAEALEMEVFIHLVPFEYVEQTQDSENVEYSSGGETKKEDVSFEMTTDEIIKEEDYTDNDQGGNLAEELFRGSVTKSNTEVKA